MVSPEESDKPGKAPELRRALGAWSAASILIGAIIGSGIFKKPAAVAAALPSPGWILVCWIAAGALALIGSLIFAELSAVFPGPGGQYTFLRKAFGDLPAFLFGWTNLVVINSASIAALAVISGEFAFNLLPTAARPAAGSHWYRTLPVVLVVALTALNVVDVRWGARLQNILTISKLGALGLIIAGVFFPAKTNWSNFSPFWEVRDGTDFTAFWLAMKGAFLAIFWAYDGWYLLGFSGGEVRNPRRNIPLGFIGGILVVVGVYLAFNIAILALIPLEEIATVTRHGGPAGEAAFRLYGGVGLTLISAGIVASTFGAANANVLSGPRLAYAMARDGLFLRSFGTVHPRFRTPLVAVVAQGTLGAAYIYAGTFDELTDSVVFAAWIFYLLTVIGYFRLRRAQTSSATGSSAAASETTGFRAPWFPLLPLLFVVFATVFVVYTLYESAAQTLEYLGGSDDPHAASGVYFPFVLLLIAAGLPLYRGLRKSA